MTYYGTQGLLHTFAKPGGQVNTFDYDALGLLTKDSHSGGYFQELIRTVNGTYETNVEVITSMSRSSKIQATAGSDNFASKYVTDASGKTQTYSYIPQAGGATESLSQGGANSSVSYVDDARLGSMKRFKSTVTTSIPGIGDRIFVNTQTVTLSDPADPFSIMSYVTTSQLNGGSVTQSSTYDPLTKTFLRTTALGKTTEEKIDVYERVISTKIGNLQASTISFTLDKMTSITQGVRNTTYGYNPTTGFLESITNPLSQVTAFINDNAGRVVSKILPDSRVVSYGYDANGNTVSIVPPGKPIHYFSFNSQELNSAYSPPALSGVATVNTTYQYNLDKQLTGINRPDGSFITFNFNSVSGNLESYETAAGVHSVTLDTATGLPTAIYLPDNSRIAITYYGPQVGGYYWYDSSYNLTGSYLKSLSNELRMQSDTVSNSLGSTSTISYLYNDDEELGKAGDVNISYHVPNGYITGTTMGTGTTGFSDTYTYNTYGEITGYSAKRGTTTLYSLTLNRDASGRIDGKSQTMNSLTDSFVYTFDSTGRITQTDKNSSTVATYSYDSNSNRNGGTIGSQPTTATYDDQDRLLTYNTLSFTYNANGDLATKTNSTTSQTTTYTYDVFGNLRQVSIPPSTTIVYDVDGLNRRIAKRVNGTVQKRWVYMDQYRIAAELNSSGAITKRFIYGSKKNIPDYMIASGVKYRIISDHLGSPRLVVKQSDGTILQRMNHDEFGRVTEDTNPGYLPFGFAGGLYDNQTGLVRFGARDFDPEIGRWTSKDPILFEGGDTNLFGYVAQDPVNWVDPDGKQMAGVVGVAIGVAIRIGAAISCEIGSEDLATKCAKERHATVENICRKLPFSEQGKCLVEAGMREAQCNQGL